MSNEIETLTTDNRRKLREAIKQMSDSMVRMDAEKAYQKDVVNRISDDIQIEKKIVRKLARTYYKQNFPVVKQENEDFEASYMTVFSSSSENPDA